MLDFRKEAKTIKSALRESGMQVMYCSKVATKANFEETIRKQVQGLHISCHGIYDSKTATMGFN